MSATGARPPGRVPLPYGHHLRPLRIADTAADLVALTGSPARLAQLLGDPVDDPVAVADRHAEHVRQRVALMADGLAWTWLLLDDDETAVLGRVEVDPSPDGDGGDPGGGALGGRSSRGVRWFVVDECAGTALERAVAEFLPRWLRATYRSARPVPGGR